MQHASLSLSRRRSQALLFALCLSTALALPARLHSMRVPDMTLAGLPETSDTPEPQGHVVRRLVGGMTVRMAVDPLARSPLDRRLAVKSDLETPSKAVAPVAPVASAPAGKTPRRVAVKIPPRTEAPVLEASVPMRDVFPDIPAPSREGAPFPAPSQTLSFLTVGDSLSIGLADALEKRLAKIPGLRFAKSGKISSGLARPDFYDWEAHLDELAGRYVPDLAVIMIATNDDKSLRAPSGKVIAFGAKDWDDEYARRVQNLIDIARRHNPAAKIFWMGAPVMADAGLNHRVRIIEEVIRDQLARNANAWFIEADKTLADASGRFALSLPAPSGKTVAVRYKDGIHVTPSGADILAQACLSAIASRGLIAAAAPKNRRELAELAEK